ncbi:MAG: SDR family NAD(P)-dependent oxidoreductase [Planctomycetes bacterium]|jgi:NAD(P)-dependent dehydrogenase (short-subunit alcohol dehydrogenase family)|nr:SDR family NAD(P)-dependent oxidoreductase [Planctomycetota bacterium]MBT4028925.1 SDR family NAD(P)-dependent oxidoreductase [Planctomycetota bacterium]MBT4559875.1 SDR family NAD(P)-dependent oxidoreductase [Planctomycetota bacterium]MBT5120568.1 SDR family NAD(P)-dependent oxidoreductase [Planctomycetota bacterium]MBT7013137.1 SDR family NAD(P)-dependent oxidoreductase [Planctomycetota bacterium]
MDLITTPELSSLVGRTIVITGASSGLGAGMAETCKSLGMRVAGCGLSMPSDACEIARQVDVADELAMAAFAQEVVQAFGVIDLWVNNAGVLEPIAPLRDLVSSDLRRHMDINFMGVFFGMRDFLNHQREHGGEGVVMNISSGAAWNGYAGWAAYCAGKAAVERLTEATQLDEAAAGNTGFRAYAVAPGIIDTAMQETIRACDESVFPMVGKFLELKENDAFFTPDYVARHMLSWAFGGAVSRPDAVCVSVPGRD